MSAVVSSQSIGRWFLTLTCFAFGGFAFWAGLVEILSLTGLVHEAKARAVPPVFVFHAIAGACALIFGPLQFNRRLRTRHIGFHRAAGRAYVGAAWIASIGGTWSAVFFEVEPSARIAFVVAGIFWFTTTTIGFAHARHRKSTTHREWMIRSFALSFFFVTFEFWVAGLEAAGLDYPLAHPLGVLFGWSVNLAVAETWIRRSRPEQGRSGLDERLKTDPGATGLRR